MGFRAESHVMIDIGLQTVTNQQHIGSFLQQGHHRRFLAIAFYEIRLG